MKKQVILTHNISEEGMALLQKRTDIEIQLLGSSKGEIYKLLPEASAILCRMFKMDAELIALGSKLEIIAQHGAGIDAIDINAATKKGILVTNTPTANSISVAEYVIALMLTLSRKLIPASDIVRSGAFEKRDMCLGNDLHGKCLAICGLGNIGKRIAERLNGFHMHILGYDPYVSAEDMAWYGIEKAEHLPEMLSKADFISVNLPGLENLRGLFDAEMFGYMRPTAYFINCARGMLVDETALADALNSGKIAGAAIDVTDPEPLSRNSPLWTATNLMITPHIAASTAESMTRMSLDAVQSILDCLDKKCPRYPVNPSVIKS